MPLFIKNPSVMEDKEIRFNVVDVYDLATDIAKEVEKIIDQHGVDALRSFMPKVIYTLEHLEKFAYRNETSTNQIDELKIIITQLENDKICKSENRKKYEKELEEIEDRLREQSNELVAMVTSLQDENRRITTLLAQSEGSIKSNSCSSEPDMKVVTKLKALVDRQTEQLRSHERDINEKEASVDSLTLQVEKVTYLNKELRRRQRLSSSQMKSLIDERAELQAELQEELRTSAMLKQRLGLAEKENQDLSLSSNESVDLSNKLVYDRDDPSRPRFTMEELKEILYERNELKARVSDLEDELDVFRPKPRRQSSHIICPPLDVGQDSEEDSDASVAREEPEEDDDPPVQGPIPYEPEDAPWKKANKSESGIRKFFMRLFADTSPAGTPRKHLFKF